MELGSNLCYVYDEVKFVQYLFALTLREALTFRISYPSEPTDSEWSFEDANRLNEIYSTGSLFKFF